MGKYDNVTMKEYMQKKKEMFEDLGADGEGSVCSGVSCEDCPFNSDKTHIDCELLETEEPDKALEIVMEYEPYVPKVDWENVPVDTKVLVKHNKYDHWVYRHFAKVIDGLVYVWDCGTTSFTSAPKDVTPYKYAKLYKGE